MIMRNRAQNGIGTKEYENLYGADIEMPCLRRAAIAKQSICINADIACVLAVLQETKNDA